MQPLQTRVGLGAMAIKRFSAFPKAPALLKPHYQIVKCHIVGEVLSLCRDADSVFYRPNWQDQILKEKFQRRFDQLTKKLNIKDTIWKNVSFIVYFYLDKYSFSLNTFEHTSCISNNVQRPFIHITGEATQNHFFIRTSVIDIAVHSLSNFLLFPPSNKFLLFCIFT